MAGLSATLSDKSTALLPICRPPNTSDGSRSAARSSCRPTMAAALASPISFAARTTMRSGRPRTHTERSVANAHGKPATHAPAPSTSTRYRISVAALRSCNANPTVPNAISGNIGMMPFHVPTSNSDARSYVSITAFPSRTGRFTIVETA